MFKLNLPTKPNIKGLDSIVESIRNTLNDLNMFVSEKTEEKLLVEDRLIEINNDIEKSTKIQNNLKKLLGEDDE